MREVGVKKEWDEVRMKEQNDGYISPFMAPQATLALSWCIKQSTKRTHVARTRQVL